MAAIDPSLYTLIRKVVLREMIRSQGGLRPTSAASRPSPLPSPAGQTSDTFPYPPVPRILEGGEVLATDPTSLDILQEPLIGYSRGLSVRVREISQITIPTNVWPKDFYVTVPKDDVVQITGTVPEPDVLITAVIHLPDSLSVPIEIWDDAPEDPGQPIGWIESFREDTSLGTFEIDSQDAGLRNAIKEIAASAIVGELVLTQFLKIRNAEGSVLLDSEKMEFRNEDGKLTARFTETALTFFDTVTAIEVASFGGSQARVGNIEIHPSFLQSSDYVARTSGFRIDANGDVEFGRGFFRGDVEIPALSVAAYDSGSRTFRLQRRQHFIENLGVLHGQQVPFSGLVEHDGNHLPDFQNKPLITLIENEVTVWEPTLMSGTNVVNRRLLANPLQSGSTSRWNAMRITALLVISGGTLSRTFQSGETIPAGTESLRYGWKALTVPRSRANQFSHFLNFPNSPTLGDDHFNQNVGAAEINEGPGGYWDAFFYPESGTYAGASGEHIDLDVISNADLFNDLGPPGAPGPIINSCTVEQTYYLYVGQSGNPLDLSLGVTPQTGTVTMDLVGVSGTVTRHQTTTRFSFPDLPSTRLDWAVMVEYANMRILAIDPAIGWDLSGRMQMGPDILEKIIYRTASGTSVTINPTVDVEITEA